MILGIVYIMAACLFWALVFIAPMLAPGFSPIEITLGRFSCFAMASVVALLWKKRHLLQRKYILFWKKALGFGFLSTFVCYTGTLLGIQYSGATLATLIFGMSPLTITLYGNFRKKEYSNKTLLLPLSLVGLGLLTANSTPLLQDSTLSVDYLQSLIGIGFSFASLAAWTWFAVANHNFLEKNKTISSSDWITMMGSWLLPVSILFSLIYLVFQPELLIKYTSPSPKVINFLIQSVVLGVISSWGAFFLWNLGNLRLPISLTGQLSAFEMIFGLTYIFLLEARVPLFLEASGICIILYGLYVFFQKIKQQAPLSNN